MRAAVDDGGFIELAGNRVEGSLDEPHLPQCSAHERQAVAGQGVEAEEGDDLADVGDHRVDGDHGQDRGEHHNQEQGEQAAAASGEAEPGEGVGPQQGQEDLSGGHHCADDDRVEVPAQEWASRPRQQVLVVDQTHLGGDQPGGCHRAQGVERGGDDVEDGEGREDQGDDADDVPPADLPEPA